MKTLAACALAMIAAPALADPPDEAPAADEVRIPFANARGIRTFHAESDEILYLQDRRRNWYRAELVGPCWGLRGALRIGYDTHGSSSFDRFSHILVGPERCPIASLARSARPERKRRR